MMQTRTSWALVADEAIARILCWPERGDELEPVEELTDPSAHAGGTDLRRDAYGRRAGSATHGARPGTPHRLRSSANVTASAGEDPQHLGAELFARRVAQRLAEALQQHRYDELRVAAAPRFLGLLRKAFSPQVSASVTRELDKDLIHLDPREITGHLFPERAGGGAGPASRLPGSQ